MEIKIRFLNELDIDSLIELINDNFSILGTKQNIKSNMNDTNRFLGAFIDNKLVGNVLIEKQTDFVADKDNFHLAYICVSESYQNNHIATRLLEEVERIARQEDISFINLTSSYFRVAAHHLYQKLNYEKRESCLFIKEIKKDS